MSQRTWRLLALLVTSAGPGMGCGGGGSPTAPPTPVPTATPLATVTETFRGEVAANGGIQNSIHLFSMTREGVVEGRLSEISPPTSQVELILCQGDFIAAGTCGPLSSGEGTSLVRIRLAGGTNTAYVAKTRLDAGREPTSYVLTIVRPR